MIVDIPGVGEREIDDDLIELILALNKMGLHTQNCCSGHGKADAYINFSMKGIRDIAIHNDEHGHRFTIWWDPNQSKQNLKHITHSEVKPDGERRYKDKEK